MYDPVFDEYYYIGQGSKPVLDGKWYEAEPIWVTAEKQDQTAMTMFWPASEAEILGIRPTEYFVYDGSISHNARVDQILKWLDYAPSKRPQFVSTYFSHMDDVGHDHGPDSEEVIAGIQEMDRTIGRLIGGLKSRDMFKNTNIILVTDHGMASTSPDSMIFLDDYIDMDNVTMVDWTPVASILPKGNVDPIYVKLKNAHPKLSVYKKGVKRRRNFIIILIGEYNPSRRWPMNIGLFPLVFTSTRITILKDITGPPMDTTLSTNPWAVFLWGMVLPSNQG